MNRNIILAAVLILICLTGSARGSHILGGEIRMETTGDPSRFSFSMIQFWDENRLTVANREPSVEILFYRKRDNQLVFRTSLPFVSSRSVDYKNLVCSGMRSLKTVEGTYNATVTLNPGDYSDPEGYYIVWERCCRNAEISNIKQPGGSGLVFYLEFPPLSIRNSSPVFNFPNGDYICQGLPYSTNLSATDSDGDELRYSLVTPFRGNTDLDSPIGNDSPKTGYPLVEWSPGISEQNMVPGNPALNINAQTGRLVVTASQLGLFVFTVQCEEFRNGVRIGVVRRDFQSLVIECSPNVPPTPTVLYQQQFTPRIEFCGQNTKLEVAEAGDWAYQWQLNAQDIPGATSSSLTISETGNYTVSRLPKDSGKGQCSLPAVSKSVEVILGATSAVLKKSRELICSGTPLTLNANKNDSYSYEWRKGKIKLDESGPSLTVGEPGNYILIVGNKVNGCTATDSVEVKSETVQVTLPKQIEVLQGQSVKLDPTITSSPSTLSYQWSPPIGLSSTQIPDPIASPDQTTEYTVLVNTPGGCQASATVKVIVNQCREVPIPTPIVTYKGQIVENIEICPGLPVLLQTEDVGNWIYQWQLDGKPISGATQGIYTAYQTGNFTLVRSAKNEDPAICMKPVTSSAINIIAATPPVANIDATGTVLCAEAEKNIYLNAGKSGSVQYRWVRPEPLLPDSSAELEVRKAGIYKLEVFDKNTGCSAIDSILIVEEAIKVVLPEEISVKRGESLQLRPELTTSIFPVTYLWSPSAGLSNPTDSLPFAQPNESTRYRLLVETPGGCQASDSISVLILDQIFLPEAFSPNGDGFNDVFSIPNGPSLIENIRIYNRWGQVIFNEIGYDIPWDGYFKNEVVASGVYTYTIKTNTHVYNGSVRVIY